MIYLVVETYWEIDGQAKLANIMRKEGCEVTLECSDVINRALVGSTSTSERWSREWRYVTKCPKILSGDALM